MQEAPHPNGLLPWVRDHLELEPGAGVRADSWAPGQEPDQHESVAGRGMGVNHEDSDGGSEGQRQGGLIHCQSVACPLVLGGGGEGLGGISNPMSH